MCIYLWKYNYLYITYEILSLCIGYLIMLLFILLQMGSFVIVFLYKNIDINCSVYSIAKVLLPVQVFTRISYMYFCVHLQLAWYTTWFVLALGLNWLFILLVTVNSNSNSEHGDLLGDIRVKLNESQSIYSWVYDSSYS